MVMTLFDELVRIKHVALLRGDVIWGLTQDEGGAVMDTLLDMYLVDSNYESVRAFNHDQSKFSIEHHT